MEYIDRSDTQYSHGSFVSDGGRLPASGFDVGLPATKREHFSSPKTVACDPAGLPDFCSAARGRPRTYAVRLRFASMCTLTSLDLVATADWWVDRYSCSYVA